MRNISATKLTTAAKALRLALKLLALLFDADLASLVLLTEGLEILIKNKQATEYELKLAENERHCNIENHPS